MEKKGMLVPVVLALAAAAIYWWVLTSKERDLAAQNEPATVLVAKYDLPARTIMNVDLVETRVIPKMYIEQDSYEVKSQSDIKLVSNLVTSVRIPKGNQITQSALVSLSPEAGLSVKVPPGYRGCVLPLENDLLRLIKPGDRVDILVSFDAVMGDNRKEKVTATILQNVLVLGVGSNLGQGLSGGQAKAKAAAEAADQAFSEKAALSLALNPNEAQYLALSVKQGSVDVIVRGLGDVELHPMEIASFKRLIKS
ncbi:MAG: Flp pilus assembly protein CpaB [Elusimicrobia bacterium GWA2_61_42]|nr:MAG: Flp pilus assembly protein CpaB [Elusimicrobia bacterium GWA2_61_42]OGR80403.1 MAG: Flp pilus assembly protein CpaB [Elusimicrobia bacterium GWC2_61_25]